MMDQNKVDQLKNQLHAAADQLLPGKEGRKTLCRYILTMLNMIKPDAAEFESASAEDFADLARFYTSLLQRVSGFAAASASRPLTEQEQMQIDDLNDQIRSLEGQIDRAKAENARLKAERAKKDGDLRIQAAKNLIEQQKVEEEEAKLQEALLTYANLQQRMQNCTPQIIAKQKQDNDVLALQVAQGEADQTRCEEEHASLNGRLQELQDSITALQGEINAMPEDLRLREMEYTRLQEQRTRIANAITECSDERQAALREEISALEPQAKALKEAFDEIQAQHARLIGERDKQLQDNAQAEQDLLNVFNEVISKLDVHSADLAARLREAMTRADRFEENLALCRNHYERYRGWLDSLVPVLEAMRQKAGLSQPEYDLLYSEMNPNALETVQTLLSQIREGLTRLDEITSTGAQAAGSDQQRTQTRAEQGESAARHQNKNNV